MVFSSVLFLHYFLPTALITGISAQRILGTRIANGVLLVASVAFYAWGLGSKFLWLLALSVLCNYLLAIAMQRSRDNGDKRLGAYVSWAAIAFNIGILIIFKYANFAADQANGLRELFGMTPWAWESIALPIGISFFTFHALSYVWDVKSGAADALRNPVDLALYICLFPQLIAGPIIRYRHIHSQIADRTIDVTDVSDGSLRFLHGLAKKVVIADPAGAIAGVCFGADSADITSAVAWLGAIAYTIQIYFDFSGYSDMAIGLARMFGFRFPENFDRPYASRSITEFWRRWHMSLSAWFRDYVYIPLGGSRVSTTRTYANLLVVFALTGFWHGANWTFLVWGLYHGMLLIIERLAGVRSADQAAAPTVSWQYIVAKRTLVLFLIIIGWVLFRAATISDATHIISRMILLDGKGIPAPLLADIKPDDVAMLFLGGLLALLPATMKGPDMYHHADARIRVTSLVILLMLAVPFAVIKISSNSFSPFLYFQF